MRQANSSAKGGFSCRREYVSSRQAFRRVRRAYVAAETGGLQVAYQDARWRTRAMRPLLALADRLYPMTEAVHFAGEMDRRIREDGLAAACSGGTERLGLECDFVMSDATRDVLASAPVIVYGNHPTMLTPFLLGAAVRRPDLRFFMVSYVGHLIPSLRAYMLPLEIRASRSWSGRLGGGNRKVLEHWLTRILEKGREPADAKPANRQTLGRGGHHVASGGCVVIFPGGGGRRDRAWYPGIGHLVAQLARSPQASEVFLVAMREEGSSDDHVYAGLRRIGGSTRPCKLSRIRVRFAEPHRLADLGVPNDAPGAIAAHLQAHYETLFPSSPARPRVLEWLFFPWRLAVGRHRA